MNRYLSLLLGTATAALLTLTSCKDEQGQYQASGYNVIQSISLGRLERKIMMKTATGKDTAVFVSVNTKAYPLTIDQLHGEIYNNDSLPKGTLLKKVLIPELKSLGVTTIRTLDDGVEKNISEKDTLDLSVPRTLTVWAEADNGHREYTLRLRVHQEEADSFKWQRMGTAQALTSVTEQKALIVGEQIYIFAIEQGQRILLTAPVAQPTQLQHESVTSDIDPYSVIYFDRSFFALAQNQLVRSTDGIHWKNMPESTAFTALLAPGTNTLTAVNAKGFYVSNDTGKTFHLAKVDTPDSLLQNNIAAVNIPLADGTHFEHLLIVGRHQNLSHVWKHTVDLNRLTTYPFMFYSNTPTTYRYPELLHPSMFRYDSGIAVVGETTTGRMTPFYMSYDDGISWHTERIPQPQSFGATSVSATVDSDHFIYLFCGGSGEIWRGRLNALSWRPVQRVFN